MIDKSLIMGILKLLLIKVFWNEILLAWQKDLNVEVMLISELKYKSFLQTGNRISFLKASYISFHSTIALQHLYLYFFSVVVNVLCVEGYRGLQEDVLLQFHKLNGYSLNNAVCKHTIYVM